MSPMLDTMPMAKAKGRPPSDRDDVTVKVDRRIAVRARTVAGFLGVSMAELLSGMLDGPVMQAYAEMVRQMPVDPSVPRPSPPRKGGKP